MQDPSKLSDAARQFWDKYIDEHSPLARKTCLFLGLEAYDRAQKCKEVIDKEGMVLVNPITGQRRAHPLLAAEKAARNDALRVIKRIGQEVEGERQGKVLTDLLGIDNEPPTGCSKK